MLTIYTLCVYFKGDRMNAYIDFKDKDKANIVAETLKANNELVAFTDIVRFDY